MQKFDFFPRNFFFVFIGGALCLILLTAAKIEASAPVPQQVAEKQISASEAGKRWSGESYRRAVALYLEAAQDWATLGETAKSAECLRQAARLEFLLADYAKAKETLLKAVEIEKKSGNAAGQSKAESLLALIFLEDGNRAESEKFSRQAVENANRTDDLAARAAALLSEAEFNYFYGDADTTVRLFEEVVRTAEKSGDARIEAQSLLNLAYAYCKQGKAGLGLKNAEQALAVWREIGDERGQAVTYPAIGMAYKMLDEGQNALNAYFSAEAMFPPDTDLIEKARLSTGIASVYGNYNTDDLTKIHLQKAYDLYGQAKYPAGQFAVLPYLVKYNYATGDHMQAEKYFEEVKVLTRQFKNDIFLGYTNEIIGNVRLKNGEPEEAIKAFSQALAIFEQFKNKKGVALARQRLGEAFLKKGETAAATENFNRALEINREIRDKFAESETLYQLAKTNAPTNPDAALELVKNSIELTENLTSDIINTKLKSAYFSNVFDRYELYINLLMRRGAAMQALQAAERSRARIMLENLSLAEASLTKDADAATIEREKEFRVLLNAKADKLTDLLSRNADKSETEKISFDISQLENELAEIRGKLKQQSLFYAAIKNPAPFDATEFQKNVLDENTVLLEFSLGATESYLWLIEKSQISSYVLPPRVEIAANVNKLRELIKQRGLQDGEPIEDYQARLTRAEAEFQTAAKDLSRQLFVQIAGKLTNKRLVIVPDGELHYFPIAALPLPDTGGDEPILLTNETVYEPSAQSLAVLSASRSVATPPKNLLLFSDPVFTSDDARLSPENKAAEKAEAAQTERFRFVESLAGLPRLTASKDESETILGIVGANAADNYSGFAATRDNLLNVKTEDYKILHFATHGLTDEKRPELSGIVLSRYDEKGGKLNEFFRLHDIYGLNLNADLVVLSACETGVGKEIKGEGLMSLNNAFLQTGAKAVMASLWKVEDGATLELMKNFYGAMANESLTPSQSLRKAQIKLRENPHYKSPFFWSAFTVQGDFRTAPQISRGFGFWVYLLPILIVLLIEEFLDDALSAEEKELFNKNYLTTPERIAKLKETALLRNHARSFFTGFETRKGAEERSGFFESIKALLTANIVTVAAVFLVLVIGAVVWSVAFYEANGLSPIEKEYAALNAKDLNNATEAANLTSKSLIAGTFRDTDSASKLKTESLTENVLFRLALPSARAKDSPLNLELARGGQTVFRQNNLRVYQNPNGQEVKVILPKAVLTKGNYQIKLSSGASYGFAVE